MPPTGEAWVHEVKFDGYRMQLRAVDGRAVLRTRKGLDWTAKFPEIAAHAAKLPDCLLDGEICALDRDGVTDFGGLQQALSDGKTSSLIFFLFDCLFAGGRDLRNLPLDARKSALELLLEHAKRLSRLRFVPHFASDGRTILDAACKADLEGIVSKRLDSPYVSGRMDTWTKAKCRGGQEVVIGGWRGDERKLRSLLVGAFDDGKLIYMGRVGTGFPASIASEVLARMKPLRRAAAPFSNPPRGADFIWIEPKLVGEIEFENITSDRVFRQASFKGLRLDKSAKSVVLETPRNTDRVEKDAVMELRKSAPGRGQASASKPTVLGIAITHADKVLWPKTKDRAAVTKLDLAHYYEAAADKILAHISGRPISVVRAPDGIEGELFFQRHKLMGTAAPMLALKVRGEEKPYLGVDNPKSLIALGQVAVLEIHPWGSKPGDPDSPERIILDLDPAPDVSFANVMESARELRQRLAALGFTPFVKTTGGKGLHVVIAVKGTAKKPVTWQEAKAFAKAMAIAMERDSPERYTTTISKKARPGKIFVDYLRNDRTSTGVAPWSPRARPRATIAVPLAWAQVKAGLDPQRFTIEESAALLRRPDPWKELAASARPIEAALRHLSSR